MFITENSVVEDLIVAEWDQRLSRQAYTFRHSAGSTTDFKIGQQCVISSGKMIPSTGTTWSGILLKNLFNVADATEVTNIPFLVRGPAIVNKDELAWDAGADASDQAAQLEAMSALCIGTIAELPNVSVGGE